MVKEMTLATTTSAQDSGLLDHLLPRFKAESGYKVKVHAVGSGMAMDLARKGQADVLLVHDPVGEEQLLNEGIGINRKLIMHNDFILVGPSTDPAKVKDLDSIVDAFHKIAQTESIFISRGDASGTDKREKMIWQKAGLDPHNANYQEIKGGMAETLAVASGKQGYALTDRATYLAQKHDLNLEVMVEGDDLLLNMYHVIQVNPAKYTHVNSEGAQEFTGFLVGSTAQSLIGNFMKDRFGQSLFMPDAGKTADDIAKGDWKQVVV